MTECHVPSVVSDDADENETSTGRPEAKFRFRLEGRICQTDRPRPCDRDPEPFFNPATTRRPDAAAYAGWLTVAHRIAVEAGCEPILFNTA
jgi:hypothetical protein